MGESIELRRLRGGGMKVSGSSEEVDVRLGGGDELLVRSLNDLLGTRDDVR